MAKNNLKVDEYVKGVLNGDRSTLARAITLIESANKKNIDKAQEVLQKLLPHSGNSIRIGITGSPGSGKSTFIDTLGGKYCDKGHKVCVLAVDPSSNLSRGSILGDKTRMEKLSQNENAFIRPSPSGGVSGGVARRTRETILVCEAAGFDVILIETIGVGQSEVTVRSMVDFFLLLLLPGGGDELQGIKKGSMEMSDAIIVNKADNGNENYAEMTRRSYENVMSLVNPFTKDWAPPVLKASAYYGCGIDETLGTIDKFVKQTKKSGVFQELRKKQLLDWLYAQLENEIRMRFFSHPTISNLLPEVEKEVLSGHQTPLNAVKELIEVYGV